MSRLRKWQHSIGIGLETTFGAPVAPAYWLPGKSTVKTTPGVRKLDNPVGEWDESRYTEEPPKTAGGLTLEVAPGRLAAILWLLERQTPETMRTVTMYDVWGATKAFINMGLCANTAEFACVKGEDLTVDFDCFARQREAITPPAPAFNKAPAPYVFKEMRVMAAGAYIGQRIETVKFKFDHKVQDDDYRADGTGLVKEFGTDGREIIISLDHVYETHDMWQAGRDKTEMALGLTWTRGAHVLSAVFPRAVINEGMDVDEDGKQPLQLKAYKPLDGGDAVTVSET